MENLKFQHIFLSTLFSLGGTIGGWAMTGKLAGDAAALSFLKIGIVVVLCIATLQFILFSLRVRRLVYQLLFNVAFVCGIVWFMLCLILPIFWADNMSGLAKCLIFSLLMLLCVGNMIEAKKQFECKWMEVGEVALDRYRNIENSAMDWKKIVEALKFSIALHVPGVPRSMTPFISIVSILSMVAGLSFRNLFPVASLFAWAVPTCVALSVLIQMIGLGVAQVIKVVALEKRYGAYITSTD